LEGKGRAFEDNRSSFLGDADIRRENLLFSIAPGVGTEVGNPETAVREALAHPACSLPLKARVKGGDRILIAADDITRPTPQRLLLPPLLRELREAGIPESRIVILIALGTHRRMTAEEISGHFGPEVAEKYAIFNHEYDDPKMLVPCGLAEDGTPILVNKRVLEADFVIGISSIVPHAQVGWGGGAKIILPGVAGEETVAGMHYLAAMQPNYPRFAGQVENPVRALIEEVALKVGLKFILNAIFDARCKLVRVVAGHPIEAHRTGVRYAGHIFIRPIPELADIVIVNAQPADLEYWQGLKPVTLASLSVKEGGIIILCGRFREGISVTHKEVERYGSVSRTELDALVKQGSIKDSACIGALYQHILVRERAAVFCVSGGLSKEKQEMLGFSPFATLSRAVSRALEIKGSAARIGIIDQGGEVVPSLIRS